MGNAPLKEGDTDRPKKFRLSLTLVGSIASIVGLVSVFYSSQTKFGTWVETHGLNFGNQSITINPSTADTAKAKAAQWVEVELQKCNADLSRIRASIAGDGSSYYYGTTIADLDENELMYLRAQSGGAPLVDRLLEIRPDLAEEQNNYNSLTGSVGGMKGAIDNERENLRYARSLGPYGAAGRRITESSIANAKEKLAAYRSEQIPIGQKIIGLYGQSCELIAQARAIVAK